MSTQGWIGPVKDRGVEAIARVLGMAPGRGRGWGPCPACAAVTRASSDVRAPITLTEDGRGWICWACEARGDAIDLASYRHVGRSCRDVAGADGWAALRIYLAGLGVDVGAADPVVGPSRRALRAERVRMGPVPVPDAEAVPTRAAEGWGWDPGVADAAAAALWTPAGAATLAYLRDARRLSDAAIREFQLGHLERDGQSWLSVPMVAREECVAIKFRSLPPAKKTFRVMKSGDLPLFGCDRLPNDMAASPLVVEGELDVVACWDMGMRGGVVSGTAGAGAFTDAWLDQLEPYAGIALGLDADAKGDEGAGKIADRLGRERCARVRWPRKDAGECLAAGLAAQAKAAVDAAEPMAKMIPRLASSYRDEIEERVANPNRLRGLPSGSAKLDHRLGGIRHGLIVLSGETSAGKSSFSIWLVWELIRIGQNALVFALESGDGDVSDQLLRATIGGDYSAHGVSSADRDASWRALDAFPGAAHVIPHRGDVGLADVITTIRYMRRRRDVRVVVLDHLGFLTRHDENERADIVQAMAALSLLAEHEEMTILLLCHPNNSYTAQGTRVMMQHLAGSAAIRQYAHEVWIAERMPRRKGPPTTRIHLDKIRSRYGQSGTSVTLVYDPFACVFADEWASTPSGKRGVAWPSATGTDPDQSDEPGAPRRRRKPEGDADG